LLGELEGERQIVICDLEAGVGTLARMEPGQVDAVVVVAEPTAKSIEVARRGAAIASRHARVIAVANRVQDEADVERIRAALDVEELIVVPEEAAIVKADRTGLAPMDVDTDAPGLRALHDLAQRLVADGRTTPAPAASS
jgi:CO dehydrogenase maturation factor